MQRRNQYTEELDYDREPEGNRMRGYGQGENRDDRGYAYNRGYGQPDYGDDRDIALNQGRNQSFGEYENRSYGSGGPERYRGGSYARGQNRYPASGYNRDYAGSWSGPRRRGARPAGGYDGASYTENRNYGYDDRDYGDASNRGYGAGYYGGRQGWSENYDRGYNEDYDRDDRGFVDKASDEVRSWFGDDEAARRRQWDGHRGKGPQNYTRSDNRIEEDVNDRLTDDSAIDASAISVSVSDCEVTLDGTVASKMEKRRAEDCCDSVSGVSHVQNNLRVNNDSTERWSQNNQSSSGKESKKSGKTTSA